MKNHSTPHRTHHLERALGKILHAVFFLGAVACHAADLATNTPASQMLWYDNPAGNWENDALPIGNGRLGAMLFGGADEERIQFNESSLWEGDEKDPETPAST